MSTEMYNTLSNSPCVWLCPHCNEPNHSNSFLHDSLDSLHSVTSFNNLPSSERQNLPRNLNLDQHGRPTRSKQRKPKRNSMKCMLINCRSVKNKVADLEIEGKIFSNREVKAEILNKQFSSVFTNESESDPPSVGTEPKPSISPLMITINGVTKQLTSLKTNKACGPDNIPSWFLKEYAQEILPVLTDIYQDSINTGIVPLKWRNANVCAVFKKGKKSDPVNYRPIS